MDDYSADEAARTLYDTFVRSLEEGADLSSFSEDDLIDIYDYSRGSGDDYVTSEILACGLRNCPDSGALAERRVIFNCDMGLYDMAEKMAVSLPAGSIVRRVIDFRNNALQLIAEGVHPGRIDISGLFRGCRRGSIEDVQFMFIFDVLADIGIIDSLAEIARIVSPLCQYPYNIYSELYRYYYERADYRCAEAYCRKMTELEPFVIEHWISLANTCNGALDDRKAMEAVEFALAIDPDSIDALMSKANILAVSDPEEAIGIVERILSRCPDYSASLYLKAFLQYSMSDFDGALTTLWKYLEKGVPTKDFFDLFFMMLNSYPEEIFVVALRKYLATGSNIDAVYDWVNTLIVNRAYYGALTVLREAMSLKRVELTSELAVLKFSAMYHLGLYDEVVKEYVDAINRGQLVSGSSIDAGLEFTCALCCLYSDNTTELHKSISRFENAIDDNAVYLEPDNTGSMLRAGIRVYMRNLIDLVGGKEMARWEYDPFMARPVDD